VPSEEITRLQDDLSTMRKALKLDKPYDARDIPSALLIGFGAVIALPLVEFTSWNRLLILIPALLPGFLAYLRRYVQVRQEQPERTELRKEYQLGGMAAVAFVPAAVGFLWWSQRNGISREAAGAAIIFCIGVVLTGIGVLNTARRNYLIGGVTMIVFGVLIPMLTPQRIATVGVGLLAVVSLLTAAFLWWQTRLDSKSPDGSEIVT
jgi:membrane protein implicated in regulation of membrane protease activity